MYKIHHQVCNENLELLCVSFRPFYLPREFNKVDVFLVYVPPDANAVAAVREISVAVNAMETASPDSPKIILGDFNHCPLEDALPNYVQCVQMPTRGDRVLDRCYCSVKESYKAIIRSPIGNSDHSTIHLMSKYKTKLKSDKVIKKKVKVWNVEATEMLQTCFELTDWDTLIGDAVDLEEAADVVSSYILFCEELHISNKIVKCYPNNKPWLRKELKVLFHEKKIAFQNQDFDKLKEINKKVTKEIACAKMRYKEKLENCFRSNNSKEAWSCLHTLTGSKHVNKQAPAFVSNCPFSTANELNKFYARFDTMDFTSEITSLCSELRKLNVTPPRIDLETVVTIFKRVKANKAMGPDMINGKLLKCCARELAIPYSELFQTSLNESISPSSWKSAIVIPVPKTNRASDLNDYRPVALTSIVMKCFERLVMRFLYPSVSQILDNLQFAYQPKKSVNDAVLTFVHELAQHIDIPGCYARALFVDFSSAFNTMQIHILLQKLHHMKVPPSLILWIKDFLCNRSQTVKVQNTLSDPVCLNTGAPQGCVLSALLFILYTNDCNSKGRNVSILKYADDTVILGLIDKDETSYRAEIDRFTHWCDENHLKLNPTKTKEIVFDFRKTPRQIEPINVKGANIEIVKSYRYLGTVLDSKLSWSEECSSITSKARTRMYFLRKLRKIRIDKTILSLFYKSVIESIFMFNCVIWFGACRKQDFKRMESIAHQASKITRECHNMTKQCTDKILHTARSIMSNDNHPLHRYFESLRSGKRLRSLKCRTNRYANSFIPHAIRMCNNH